MRFETLFLRSTRFLEVIYMTNPNRPLTILQYLWDHTDESHPAIITELLAYLESRGIHANRKTVATDIRDLQEAGWDIICNRGRQNQYFIGDRGLELPELKLIIDAVQAARFISPHRTEGILEKLTRMASPSDREELRRLFVQGKAKTTNEAVLYTIDLLHTAIRQGQAVKFQYLEYTSQKEKVPKHGGQLYCLSPYDLVWDSDRYYVVGWSESHGKVVKFRVDRMLRPDLSQKEFHTPPADYDVEVYFRQVFQMYDGEPCQVTLRCAGNLMKQVIDRFGEDVLTRDLGDGAFEARVDLSASPTFYAWVFTFGGDIQIEGPENVREAYQQMLQNCLEAGK